MTNNYKNYYAITTNWLNTTVRNTYYFQTEQVVSGLRKFITSYRESFQELEANISIVWTREEYMYWTKMWKAAYNKLTIESHTSKQWRKGQSPRAAANITTIEALRIQANKLLALRKTAKEYAEIAYQATKIAAQISEVA